MHSKRILSLDTALMKKGPQYLVAGLCAFWDQFGLKFNQCGKDSKNKADVVVSI